MSFLAPAFLTDNIAVIGDIIAVMMLVIYDDYITGKLILPGVDKLRDYLLRKSKKSFKKKYHSIISFLTKLLATILFILYFMIGYWILSTFIIVPILQNLQGIILIIVIIFLLLMNWIFNSRKMRRKYFDYS